jgi:glycosyltransferase involved in cell wall biosynthesis
MNVGVTVIIPNYNCSKWLPKVIESCLIQQHLHEIIVVDDKSEDDSWEVLEKLKEQSPGIIKIYRNPKKGGNQARNFGFSKSSGDFIQWLDADDFLLEGKFENQIRKFRDNPKADIVYSDWYMDFYEDSTTCIRREEQKKAPYPDFTFEILADNWSVPANYLLKRSIAEKLHHLPGWQPETKVAQDREYFTMAALLGAEFVYAEGFYCIYNRWNANSVSSMQFKKRLKFQLELEQKFRKKIIEKNYPKKQEKQYLSLLNAHSMNACFYNPKLTVLNSFSFFNIHWKKIHWKKRPFIPLIYIWQHLKFFFMKNKSNASKK